MRANGDGERRLNGDRRPQEIVADIERTRSELDDTLSAIERRLTPGQLVDQGLDYLRQSSARDFAANLGTSVRDNPLPVALVGIGLAWLMLANRSGSNRVHHERRDVPAGESPDLGDRLGEATDRVGDAARSAMERVDDEFDRARDAARATRERIGEAADAARARAGELRESARQQVERARGGYDRMLREQPLALGAIGIALGAVVAAAAPRTRAEDRAMGPARDRLADEAMEAAGEEFDRKQRAAAAAPSDTPIESGSETGAQASAGRGAPLHPSLR